MTRTLRRGAHLHRDTHTSKELMLAKKEEKEEEKNFNCNSLLRSSARTSMMTLHWEVDYFY